MTGSTMTDDIDSEEEELIMEALNENYRRQYVIDMNYNRPLKNFPLTLNMIEEVDETSVKSPETDEKEDENGNFVNVEVRKTGRVAWSPLEQVIPITNRVKSNIRPKSASSAAESTQKPQERAEKRPKSSCANYPSRIPVKTKELRIPKTDSESSSNVPLKEDPESRSWEKKLMARSHDSTEMCWRESIESLMDHLDYPDRPTSACCLRLHKKPQRKWAAQRSNSQPDICAERSQFGGVWHEVNRFRRSLQLLGLSSSDFGLPDSPKRPQHPPRPRSTHCTSPTFSTRVLQKSYSLDCLKRVVKEAANNTYSGLPQRQILAQAAYEEWYFAKLKDIKKKMRDESEKHQKRKEIMEEENRIRGEKAAEKFQKWVEAKRRQEKQRTPPLLKAKLENRLIKSREEIDKAYLEWKKHKDQDINKKKSKKLKEEENAEREKAQKEEKRIQAEKAFKEWKKKSEEKQRLLKEAEAKAVEKIKEQLTARSKSSIEFQVWKRRKDDELMEQHRKNRESAKQLEDERSMIVNERLYEADQAFEDWLEKVDTRRSKQKNSTPKPVIPWAPS